MPVNGISPFQKEKLEYYFNFFVDKRISREYSHIRSQDRQTVSDRMEKADTDGDGYIMQQDLPGFMEKILEFTGWEENSAPARELYEVHEAFFEILKEKADHDNTNRVEMSEWMSLWEHILPGCMGMHNFPVWLRLLPKSLFRVIDTKGDGVLDVSELAEFYEFFVHLAPEKSQEIAKKAFNDMTDQGRYPLNVDGYEQIFANFLLGRTPHGPGRYIFGCFEHKVEGKKFRLISGPPPDDDEELSPNRSRNRRGSDTPRVRLVWRRGSESTP